MATSYASLPVDSEPGTRRWPGGASISVLSNGGYTYAYGPSGWHGLVQNPYALACSAFVSLGGLTFGYDQGVIANLLVMPDFRHHFPTTAFEQGVITAVLELGALFGALAAGSLADHMTRQRAITYASVIFILGSALQTVANSIPVLGLGRMIGGVGIGSLSMLAPLYMAEISPPELRGSLLSIEQFSIVLGVVLGFWFGFATRTLEGSWSWRLPLGIQLLFGGCLAIGCLALPPSPRYLVLKGQYDEAERVLVNLRSRKGDESSVQDLVKVELLEMRVEAELINIVSPIERRLDERPYPPPPFKPVVHLFSSWTVLFTPQYRHQTSIGVLVMFFQQFSGINALLYYGPSLMRSIGLEGDTVMLVSSGFVNILQFLAVIPAILWIERLGRKGLLMGGSLVMAFAHTAIAFLVWYGKDDWSHHQFLAWLAVGMIYLFTAAYGVSFGPVAWVLPSEIFPLLVRSRGVGLSTASAWWNNFIIGLITPPLIEYSPSATYSLFAISCIAAHFWARYFVVETKGVSLEEMEKLFNSSDDAAHLKTRSVKQEIEERMGLGVFVRSVVEGEGSEEQE